MFSLFAGERAEARVRPRGAINNDDVRIVKTAKSPSSTTVRFHQNGLLWGDLVAWWTSAHGMSSVYPFDESRS